MMAKGTGYTEEMLAEYTKKYWTTETFAYLWDRNARDYPDKEAIVDSKTRLTWSQAKRWIDRLALGFLESGIKRDELIAVQMPNSVESWLMRVACEKAGILCATVLRNLRHKEMEYALAHLDAVGVVIPRVFRGFDHFGMIQEIRPKLPALRHIFVVGDEVPEGAISVNHMLQQPLEERYPSNYLEKTKSGPLELALLPHTTGTTGMPKFVWHLISARVCTGRGNIERLKITSNDIMGAIAPAPVGPNAPICFAAPLVAAKIVLQESFDAEEALKLIEKERVTLACVVPAQLPMMASHPNFGRYDLSSLRVIHCGGAALAYQTAKEVEEKIKCPICQGYGAIDFGNVTMHSPDDPPEVRWLTVGKPFTGCEVKLLDDAGKEVATGEAGEIWARGPAGISGYYKDPEATKKVRTGDGWYKTEDLGRWDEQGNLLIVGRKKDMVIRGGQNIYPVEIESMLLSHPKVADVAIVGMPDPVMGEKACAYIVPKPGEKFTFEEMVSFLKERHIALYKLPERLEIMGKLPMVGEQKADKKALQQDILQKLKAEGKMPRNSR